MTERQIELVKSSFAMVAPISEAAAGLFYNRLFEIAPEVRSLFGGDMKEQGRKLMQMLALIVNGLDRLERLAPAVEDLGRRHVSYQVTADQYEVVGSALLWTLGQGLGDAFTDEVCEAWTAAYGVLASTMIGAAEAVEV
jgi:nitric oxide dioxygenase